MEHLSHLFSIIGFQFETKLTPRAFERRGVKKSSHSHLASARCQPMRNANGNRLNGFLCTPITLITWLKPGVNETNMNFLGKAPGESNVDQQTSLSQTFSDGRWWL